MVRSCSWNFKVWIQKVCDSTFSSSDIWWIRLNAYFIWIIWVNDVLDWWILLSVPYAVGVEVKLDLKGTGNSSAKKTSAGRGKVGSGPMEKKGARGSGTGAKRKRWKMMKVEAWINFWHCS